MNMRAFADELVKISGALQLAKGSLPVLKKTAPSLGLISAGALGYHQLRKELAYRDLGKRVYEQMQAQGG